MWLLFLPLILSSSSFSSEHHLEHSYFYKCSLLETSLGPQSRGLLEMRWKESGLSPGMLWPSQQLILGFQDQMFATLKLTGVFRTTSRGKREALSEVTFLNLKNGESQTVKHFIGEGASRFETQPVAFGDWVFKVHCRSYFER